MLKSHSEERFSASNRFTKPLGLPHTCTVLTVPYFSPACLEGFDTRCDRGLEQVIYFQALIEEDGQSTGRNAVAAA